MSIGMRNSKKVAKNALRMKKKRLGKNNPFWKGGISKTIEWKKHQRRMAKYKRKNYQNIGVLTLETIKQVYEDNIKKFGVLTCIYCLNPQHPVFYTIPPEVPTPGSSCKGSRMSPAWGQLRPGFHISQIAWKRYFF